MSELKEKFYAEHVKLANKFGVTPDTIQKIRASHLTGKLSKEEIINRNIEKEKVASATKGLRKEVHTLLERLSKKEFVELVKRFEFEKLS